MKSRALGYEQVAITALAVVGLTPPRGSFYAVIQADGCVVRWRDDGTDPTTTVGMKLADGGELVYDATLEAIGLIAASGSGVLNISYYEGGDT